MVGYRITLKTILIISHKHKFIFLKTRKTGGTSVEVFLSQFCGEKDIVTPIHPHVEPHVARNYMGWYNPIPEILANRRPVVQKHFHGKSTGETLVRWRRRMKYFNHIHANDIKLRLGKRIWDEYYKFTIERNPWDKTLSHFHWQNHAYKLDMSFADYLERGVFCINYPIYTDRYHDEGLMVDRVLKYENLDKELGEVCDLLGIPYDGSLDVQAKSNLRKDDRHYTEVMTEEEIRQVEAIFAKEIEMHGFTCE